jgi:hypothetical protein
VREHRRVKRLPSVVAVAAVVVAACGGEDPNAAPATSFRVGSIELPTEGPLRTAGTTKPTEDEPPEHCAYDVATIDPFLEMIAAGLLVVVTFESDPQEASVRLWSGSRTAAEIESFEPRRSTVAIATVDEVVASRTYNTPVDVPRVSAGDEVMVVEGVEWGTVRQGDSLTLLVSAASSEQGTALYSSGTFNDDGSAIVGECAESFNPALRRAAEHLDLTPAEALPELVDGYGTDPAITRLVNDARTPPPPTRAERESAYLEEWTAAPPDRRPLQIGAIPASVADRYRPMGLWFESTAPEPNEIIVVHTADGVIYETTAAAGNGPAPIVVPSTGEVSVSIRLGDGTLSQPLTSIVVPDPERAHLRLVVDPSRLSATIEVLDDDGFAMLTGLDPASVADQRASYAGQIAFEP